MRSQVSAELLIVIAVLATLAAYVFHQMQQSADELSKKYASAQEKIGSIIDEIAEKAEQ